jgi:glycosyltransferase involved in cell wall biosynthesis
VHTHSSKAGFVGRIAARRERVAGVVHTVHGWSFHDHMPRAQRIVYVGLERRAARWTDRIVVVSELDRRKGLAARIGAPDRYTMIHELNDVGRFLAAAGDREQARRHLGIEGSVPLVGTLGRLSEQKDPATFVRVAANVAARLPDARFVMIGDGPLRSEAERLSVQLGLGERLVITGVRRDVPEVLPGLDAFLLTSRWEGMPLVLPQAMACDVPVVTTTADGNRELVRDRDNGLLADPGAVDALADRVVEVLRDATLCERLVSRGRETAEGFRLEHTVPQLEDVYRSCVSDRPARGRDGSSAAAPGDPA